MIVPRPERVGNEGFSLLEMLIVTALVGLLMGGLAGIMQSGQNTFEAQQADMNIRQEARVALDLVMRETRLAGYQIANVAETLTVASPSQVQFAGDIDDGSDFPPCGNVFESAVNGGVERITYQLVSGSLLRAVDCWDGGTWINEINNQLMTPNLIGLQTLFRYFDEDGAQIAAGGGALTAAQRSAVRSIAVSFDLLDSGTTQLVGDTHANFQITAHVALRNKQ